MSIFDFFNKKIKKNILSEKEYNGNHSLMTPVDWRADKKNYEKHYTPEQISYLFDHGLLEEYRKTGASWERDYCEYWQFTDKGKKLRIWYASTYWEYLYYHVFQLFRLKYWWQNIRIKCGHHYDWEDYENCNLNEI